MAAQILWAVRLRAVSFRWLAIGIAIGSGSAALHAEIPLTPRVMERLGRGVVAVKRDRDVFVSWRLLGTEPQDAAFNVYRGIIGGDAVKLNDAPLQGGTCFVDARADCAKDNVYRVCAVVGGVERQTDEPPFMLPAARAAHAPLEIPLVPREKHTVQFAWVGDLDGDGEYDYVIDRLPADNPDPAATQKVEAYARGGRHLWTIDLGPLSRNAKGSRWNAGAATISHGHNDGVTVFDLDLDGYAEVLVQTARGTVFADGKAVAEGDDVQQFISIIDGRTGSERERAAVPRDFAADGPVAGHFGVMYLAPDRPALVYKAKNRQSTGPFNLMVNAWTFDGKALSHAWKWMPPAGESFSNFHQIRIADLDGDGRDEIVDGGYALNHKGEVFWKLDGTVHGDRFHIGKLDPARPGLQGFAVQQNHSEFIKYFYFDATTGEILRRHAGTNKVDVGRGIAADIDPAHPGYEYWAFDDIVNAVTGEALPGKRPWPNFRIWWDGDAGSEMLNRTIIEDWDPEKRAACRQLGAHRFGARHGWRDAPLFYGDILGDWREEVVFLHGDRSKLLVFSTSMPTDIRLHTLPHNPAYRACMSVKGYQQSHMLDYYLGFGMETPKAPGIRTAK